MSKIKNKTYIFAIFGLATLMSACIKDDTIDYSEWEQQNTKFVADAENEKNPDGTSVYTRLAPDWAPNAFCLVKWENDRSLTSGNLRPLSNSIVRVKYDLESIEGTRISDSYSSTTYGDSIYQTRPNANIVGFWNCVTNMHVGDSVTCIMPYVSAYGQTGNGSIKPYSTLVYHIKLVSVPSYELPN